MLGLDQSGCACGATLVRLVGAEGAFELFLELRQLLAIDGYQVVAFRSVDELVLQLPDSVPGCIVLGVQMLGPEGLDLQALLASKSDLPVILVTSSATARDVVRAMKQGAADLFCEPFDELVILSSVEIAVAQHKRKVESRELRRAFEHRRASLSPRELEVYEQLVLGASSEAICERLGLAERTLKHHRAKVMEKLGFRSMVELLRVAESCGG